MTMLILNYDGKSYRFATYCKHMLVFTSPKLIFFLQIRHNWSDVDCAKILRNVVEAMKAVPEKKDTVRLLISTVDSFLHLGLR